MNEKMNIFDIELDMLTAKDAMKRVMEYLEGETVSTVTAVSSEMLMHGQDAPEWKKQMGEMDLLLAGEAEIFETVQEVDKNFIKDLEEHVFWRMFLRYLQRNKKKVFLLAEDEEGLDELRQTFRACEKGMVVVGGAYLPQESGLEEQVINEINGVEPDCIFSVLTSPWQESFISGSKALLNARLWVGCRPLAQKPAEEGSRRGRIRQFFLKKRFRHQMGRQKSKEEAE